MRHFEAMAKIMLMASIVMGLSYASEWFAAWYSAAIRPTATSSLFEFTGAYAKLYYGHAVLQRASRRRSCGSPAMRASLAVLIGVSVAILVGMWLERILIVWNTLSHSFLPPMDRVFFPTFWDWLFLFGPIFFFALDVPALLPARAGRADVRSARASSS